MKLNFPASQKGKFHKSGITLVEMLVASTLLVIITLGLMAMFAQTQRAFKTGLREADILEGGRTATEIIARDLQQLSDANYPYVTNFYTRQASGYDLLQSDAGQTRTNRVMDFFALSYLNGEWTAMGFAVKKETNAAVGSLYRYNVSTKMETLATNALFVGFNDEIFNGMQTNFYRIADGVVHFQVYAFDEKGALLNGNTITNSSPIDQVDAFPITRLADGKVYRMPNYIEVELGVLEPTTLIQAKAMPTADTAKEFLSRQGSKVHIFRQQIPIRTAPR